MRRFFSPETGIWRFFGVVGELVMLSLLWTLCSLPLITLGTASVSLYDTVVHHMRRKDSELFGRFFETFRKEWKTASLVTLTWGAVFALLILLYRAFVSNGQVTVAVSIVFVLALALPVALLCWLFPLQSRFTESFVSLHRNALRLALGNAPASFAMVILMGIGFYACLRNVFFFFFVPGLAAWLSSFLIEPVFRRYEEQ